MREQMKQLVSENAKFIDRYTKQCVEAVNENRANIVEMVLSGAYEKEKMKEPNPQPSEEPELERKKNRSRKP